jgi:hypothetical protein
VADTHGNPIQVIARASRAGVSVTQASDKMTETKTKVKETTMNAYRRMLTRQKEYQYSLGYIEALEKVQELIEEIIAYGPNTGSNTTDILQKRVKDLVIAKYNEEW